MQDDAEREERTYEQEERCTHSFHSDDAPQDDIVEQAVKMEGAISVITNLLEDEDEERAELLKRQARHEAERCPRCGRPHHKASVES